MPQTTQLASGGARAGTRVWLPALSIPPLSLGQSVFPLITTVLNPSWGRLQFLSFFYLLCLPLLSHSVPSKVLSEHAGLEAASLLAATYGSGTSQGRAGEVDCVAAAPARRWGGTLPPVPCLKGIFQVLSPSCSLPPTSRPLTSAQFHRERPLLRG